MEGRGKEEGGRKKRTWEGRYEQGEMAELCWLILEGGGLAGEKWRGCYDSTLRLSNVM